MSFSCLPSISANRAFEGLHSLVSPVVLTDIRAWSSLAPFALYSLKGIVMRLFSMQRHTMKQKSQPQKRHSDSQSTNRLLVSARGGGAQPFEMLQRENQPRRTKQCHRTSIFRTSLYSPPKTEAIPNTMPVEQQRILQKSSGIQTRPSPPPCGPAEEGRYLTSHRQQLVHENRRQPLPVN